MFACAITLVSSRVWCTLSSVHPLQWLCSCVFYSTVVLYHYFKPRISRSNHKSSGDIAGSVQSLSHVQFFATPWIAALQASLSIINSQSLLKLMSVKSEMVVPFSSCLQSFPASGSFLMSQLSASGEQSIRASASVLPINIQD